MIINIDPHGGIPIYRQVIGQIKRQIMTGQLPEGEQLESVSVLSKRINVNPMTISKAYSYMVEEGLLERRSGIGVFVNKIRSDTRNRVKTTMLSEAINAAVTLALQMDISESEATRMFAEHFSKLDSRPQQVEGNKR